MENSLRQPVLVPELAGGQALELVVGLSSSVIEIHGDIVVVEVNMVVTLDGISTRNGSSCGCLQDEELALPAHGHAGKYKSRLSRTELHI